MLHYITIPYKYTIQVEHGHAKIVLLFER